jgi:hypothetical protein
MAWRTRLSIMVVAGSATTPLTAHAEGEPPAVVPPPKVAETTRSWELEIGGHTTFTTVPIRGGTTPFGLGFGGRFGVVFRSVYLGLTATHYLGETDVDISNYAILGGLELGYGFTFEAARGRFTLRPGAAVGIARVFHVDPSAGKSTSDVDVVTSASRATSTSDTITVDNVYIQPGITLLYAYGAPFVAAKVTALVLPGIDYGGAASTWLSYGLSGQLGLRF